MPKPGVIASQVNRFYRNIGKAVRGMDHDIGTAIIACTRAEEEGDVTVGEAWENLCKVNPRIRRFVMSALSRGAWGELVMAHAPVGAALFMKPWVQRMIPFGKIAESVAEPDEETPEGEGGLPGGMTAGDLGQMRQTAAEQARRVAERMGVHVSDEEMAAAADMAGQMMPPGLRRAQPKRTTRAQRTGGK